MAMELIESVTLTSNAASIQFSAIPQDGIDLLLVLSGRHNLNGVVNINFTINNNTSGIYSWKRLTGNGSATESTQLSNRSSHFAGILPGANLTANTFSAQQFIFSNYTSSLNKTLNSEFVYENNAIAAGQDLVAGIAATTSAITSIQITLESGANFVTNTSASLFKIY